MIGLKRDQVFISNVVKCRPPENRDPLPNEVDTCTKAYLFKQIEVIDPKVIVTLGRYSMGLFFKNAKISQIHGQPKKDQGRYYLPLFHPAAILRNMDLKPAASEDFKKIPVLLAEIAKAGGQANGKEEKKDEPPPKPTQLSLF
jgi:DNA polymerase